MASPRRSAPRAALLLGALILALGLTMGATRAAPLAQATPEPPSATPEPSPEPPSPTPEPSPSPEPPSPTPEPSATPPVAAPAQTVRLAIDKTLVGSNVVKVGQYLTFTIQITNTGSSVITDLPLVDEYATSILQPALDRTTPPPTSSAPGVLRWADLTATFGDLAPGQSVTVTAVFRAIRIDDEVINRARVEAGQGAGGGGGTPNEDAAGGGVEGGSLTVTKTLVESFIDLGSPVISFTMTLRNEGFTDIVRAPVVDTYRADLLRFLSASVPPTTHNPATGELRWDNLLAGLGVDRLRPGETVSFTTTYRLLASVDGLVVNSADAVDVEDEFGNPVASPRRAEVRIRILGVGEPTATPAPTPEEARRPRATATPTVTPDALTPTPDALTPTPDALTPTPDALTPAPTGEAPTGAAATPAAETGGPAGGVSPDASAGAPAALPTTGAARPAAAPWLLGLLALAAGLALRGAAARRER